MPWQLLQGINALEGPCLHIHCTWSSPECVLQELHAEADPHVPEPAAAEVAPATAEVAPTGEEDGLVDEVTPAVQDSTAATGEPIAEAVVALQEVMEPAPVPEPVLEGKITMTSNVESLK